MNSWYLSQRTTLTDRSRDITNKKKMIFPHRNKKKEDVVEKRLEGNDEDENMNNKIAQGDNQIFSRTKALLA